MLETKFFWNVSDMSNGKTFDVFKMPFTRRHVFQIARRISFYLTSLIVSSPPRNGVSRLAQEVSIFNIFKNAAADFTSELVTFPLCVKCFAANVPWVLRVLFLRLRVVRILVQLCIYYTLLDSSAESTMPSCKLLRPLTWDFKKNGHCVKS